MDIYIKAVFVILVCTVICLVLTKQGKDFSVLLILCVCCLVVGAAISYLRPVVELMERLTQIGQLNASLLTILLKAVGIAILSETTALVCKDAGTGSMGKALQILASAVILWLSIPLLSELIDLVEKILGNT